MLTIISERLVGLDVDLARAKMGVSYILPEGNIALSIDIGLFQRFLCEGGIKRDQGCTQDIQLGIGADC